MRSAAAFAVEYQTFNLAGSLDEPRARRTTGFNFSFTLAGIGTFSNIFGAFGGTAATRQRPARELLEERTAGRRRMVEVLVTGGAGFIGSNFVRYALARACATGA